MVGGRGNGWTDRPFAIRKREMVSCSDGRHRGVGCSSKIRRLRASSMAPPTQDRSYKHRGRCWWRSAGWDDNVGFSTHRGKRPPKMRDLTVDGRQQWPRKDASVAAASPQKLTHDRSYIVLDAWKVARATGQFETNSRPHYSAAQLSI